MKLDILLSYLNSSYTNLNTIEKKRIDYMTLVNLSLS